MNTKSIAYRALKARLRLDKNMSTARAASIINSQKEALCNVAHSTSSTAC